MTCIVGIEHKHGVLIGGDSAGTAGWSQTIRADSKVFTVGQYVMGFTSSFRMGQLLRYKLDVPSPTRQEHRDLERFMATTFIDGVRKTLSHGGFAERNNGIETGGTFLVGIGGRLFCIEDDYQVGVACSGYQAVGCGEELARGSLHTTAQFRFTPRQRAELALDAAAELSAGVAAPFVFIDQPK